VPARDLIREMMEWFLDDVVDELGSREEVEYAFRIMDEGSSADRQLAVYERTGDFKDVVDHLIAETEEGSPSTAFRRTFRRAWVMNQRYFDACTQVGAIPWMVPLLDDDTRRCAASTSGWTACSSPAAWTWIRPATAEPRHELCGRTDPRATRWSCSFVRWALEDGKPVLGVCRGMQVINVAAGGTLVQDCTSCTRAPSSTTTFPARGGRATTWRTRSRWPRARGCTQAFGVARGAGQLHAPPGAERASARGWSPPPGRPTG
jgi:hypothetical protein